jgi:DNA-binding transcriptional MocR family regulator
VCGLPQLKLGWIVVQGEPLERDAALERLHWLADAFLSVSQPVQRALPTLLAGRAGFQGAVRARVARNRGALAKALEALPDAALLPADAGWSAVIALPPVRTDEEWALALLEHDVIVHPGYFYGFDEPGRLVVSLLPPPDIFDAAVAALFAVALG